MKIIYAWKAILILIVSICAAVFAKEKTLRQTPAFAKASAGKLDERFDTELSRSTQDKQKENHKNIKKEERVKKIKPRAQMYNVKENLKPLNLVGISQDQIEDHWKLYQGYVKQVNTLHQDLLTLDPSSLVYADRRRRYGFEYNGMVLHEYYFENMISGGKKIADDNSLKKEIEKTWGSFENWKNDFIAAGKTRGIGWAILYCDPTTKRLTNNFIAEHQNGNIAGYKPILVMDVWEHAYMVDHKAGGRGDYIAAFMQNINWNVAEKRFETCIPKNK